MNNEDIGMYLNLRKYLYQLRIDHKSAVKIE